MAPRIVGRLTARRVNTARPKAGRPALVIGDGGGLWLQVTRGEGDHFRRSWTFRYEINGKRREMGLGPLFTVGLAEARARAKALRLQLLDNVDPLEAKEADRRAKLAAQARTMTFRQCAQLYLDLHQDGWSTKHRTQWTSTLKNYVYPVLGDLSVADIDQAAVMKVVQPIWNTKTVTAARIRGRIEVILDYAAASGFRGNENPARHVLVALPKKAKITKVKHYPALPWQELPRFMQELRQLQSTAARCLEFTILTAARSGEAIGALWDDEINFTTKTWTVPAERMKGGEEHEVPLSDRALEILRSQPRNGPYVFGGQRPLVETALRRQVLRRLNPSIVVHGFRSCFRTWCAEATNYPEIVAEHALAHSVGNAVGKAYRRTTLPRKRRQLMAAWSEYCCSTPRAPAQKTGETVVPLRGRA